MIALYRALKNEISFEVSLGLIKQLMMRTFRGFVGPLAERQKIGLKMLTISGINLMSITDHQKLDPY